MVEFEVEALEAFQLVETLVEIIFWCLWVLVKIRTNEQLSNYQSCKE